jgi:hypothetical protein
MTCTAENSTFVSFLLPSLLHVTTPSFRTDTTLHHSVFKTNCSFQPPTGLFGTLDIISRCRFLWQVALFFKTGTEPLSSNHTCSKLNYISVGKYQNRGIHALHGSVTPHTKPQTSDWFQWPQSCNKPIKAQHLWHHSVDKKHCFLHVKFEAKFVIFFFSTRKSMSQKKWHFSWGIIYPFFQKKGILKIPPPLLFTNWRMSGTHSAWVDRVQKSN